MTVPSTRVPEDDTEAIEVIELLVWWVLNLPDTDDTEGLGPCPGVEGAVAVEAAEEPKRRLVDENRREGRRRDEENCKHMI